MGFRQPFLAYKMHCHLGSKQDLDKTRLNNLHFECHTAEFYSSFREDLSSRGELVAGSTTEVEVTKSKIHRLNSFVL
jgi:hypothetical protein